MGVYDQREPFFLFKFQQESDDSQEEDEMTMKKLVGEKTEGNDSNNNEKV